MAIIAIAVIRSGGSDTSKAVDYANRVALEGLPIGISNHEISAEGTKIELTNNLGSRIVINEIALDGTSLNSTDLPLTLLPKESAFVESYTLYLNASDGYNYGLLINYTDTELNIEKLQYDSTLPLKGIASAVDYGIDPDENLAAGLVGLWHFDEGSWTTNQADDIKDASGFANHGTPKNGVFITEEGVIGNGGGFDGQNDYIVIPSAAIHELGHFSANVWAKSTGATGTNQMIVGKRTDSSHFWAMGYLGSGNIYFTLGGLSGTSNYNPGYTFTDSAWRHYVFIFNETHLITYVNGAHLNTRKPGGTPPNAINDHLYIGSYSSTSYRWQGTIDEVAIWNRTLGKEEIRSLYRRGIAAMEE
jgi:hypothetical protein